MNVFGLIYFQEVWVRFYYTLISLVFFLTILVFKKNIFTTCFFFTAVESTGAYAVFYYQTPFQLLAFYLNFMLLMCVYCVFPLVVFHAFFYISSALDRSSYWDACFFCVLSFLAYLGSFFASFFYFFPQIINFLFSFAFESSPMFAFQYLPNILPVFFFLSNFIIIMFFFFQFFVFLLFFVKQKRVSFVTIVTQRKNWYFFFFLLSTVFSTPDVFSQVFMFVFFLTFFELATFLVAIFSIKIQFA